MIRKMIIVQETLKHLSDNECNYAGMSWILGKMRADAMRNEDI
jgi:hypothetical protein